MSFDQTVADTPLAVAARGSEVNPAQGMLGEAISGFAKAATPATASPAATGLGEAQAAIYAQNQDTAQALGSAVSSGFITEDEANAVQQSDDAKRVAEILSQAQSRGLSASRSAAIQKNLALVRMIQQNPLEAKKMAAALGVDLTQTGVQNLGAQEEARRARVKAEADTIREVGRLRGASPAIAALTDDELVGKAASGQLEWFNRAQRTAQSTAFANDQKADIEARSFHARRAVTEIANSTGAMFLSMLDQYRDASPDEQASMWSDMSAALLEAKQNIAATFPDHPEIVKEGQAQMDNLYTQMQRGTQDDRAAANYEHLVNITQAMEKWRAENERADRPLELQQKYLNAAGRATDILSNLANIQDRLQLEMVAPGFTEKMVPYAATVAEGIMTQAQMPGMLMDIATNGMDGAAPSAKNLGGFIELISANPHTFSDNPEALLDLGASMEDYLNTRGNESLKSEYGEQLAKLLRNPVIAEQVKDNVTLQVLFRPVTEAQQAAYARTINLAVNDPRGIFAKGLADGVPNSLYARKPRTQDERLSFADLVEVDYDALENGNVRFKAKSIDGLGLIPAAKPALEDFVTGLNTRVSVRDKDFQSWADVMGYDGDYTAAWSDMLASGRGRSLTFLGTPPKREEPKAPEPESSDPLGVRNNNPLNIRDTDTPWTGVTGNAEGFETFARPVDGMRAAFLNMGTRILRSDGTLAGVVSAWAPPSENDTDAYIQRMSELTGIAPDEKLDIKDKASIVKLGKAMANHENGGDFYTDDMFTKAYDLAYGA